MIPNWLLCLIILTVLEENTWQESAFGRHALDHLSRVYFSLDKLINKSMPNNMEFLMMDDSQSWGHDSAQGTVLRFYERAHDEVYCWSEIPNVECTLKFFEESALHSHRQNTPIKQQFVYLIKKEELGIWDRPWLRNSFLLNVKLLDQWQKAIAGRK